MNEWRGCLGILMLYRYVGAKRKNPCFQFVKFEWSWSVESSSELIKLLFTGARDLRREPNENGQT
jgi:hypothetical protein